MKKDVLKGCLVLLLTATAFMAIGAIGMYFYMR